MSGEELKQKAFEKAAIANKESGHVAMVAKAYMRMSEKEIDKLNKFNLSEWFKCFNAVEITLGVSVAFAFIFSFFFSNSLKGFWSIWFIWLASFVIPRLVRLVVVTYYKKNIDRYLDGYSRLLTEFSLITTCEDLYNLVKVCIEKDEILNQQVRLNVNGDAEKLKLLEKTIAQSMDVYTSLVCGECYEKDLNEKE